MNRNSFLQMFAFIGLMMFSHVLAPKASAYELTFYYEPETGNISLDTANTRSGEILTYYLEIFEVETGIRFRTENYIQLSSSPLVDTLPHFLGEVYFNPLNGFYTIGDVLPTGLSENTWRTLFTSPTGRAGHTPGLGMTNRDPVEFIYGRPNREYDNRWDLVDPDSLEWATAASLIYREATGEVLLDTRGSASGHISGFFLRSEDQFLYDLFTPPWESPFQLNTASAIELLGNAIEPGLHSLGRILKAGLSNSQYESLLTQAKFFGSSGFTGDLDLETEGQVFALVFEAVPEPNSTILFSTAMLLLGFGRRSYAARVVACE